MQPENFYTNNTEDTITKDGAVEEKITRTEKMVIQSEGRHRSRIDADSVPITKFIIEKEPKKAINLDSRVYFEIKKFTVARSNDEKPFEYYKISDLSNTESVEVCMRSDTGLESIDLPQSILDKLAEYIRNESLGTLGEFDCASFAHFVSDVPYTFGKFDSMKWNLDLLSDESVLKIGDTVMITDDTYDIEKGESANTAIRHFALYLGSGLYISKFGTGGKLMVARLDEMKNGFDGTKAFKLTPNQRGIHQAAV